MLRGKHIVVGISGGIAAYKIPELIRLLVKAGAEVRVATTQNALEFVTELTLRTLSGAPVYSDVFAAINHHATEHISLPDWADLMVVAPATANVLGKFAAGIADDALTTTFCATAARRPIVIAPAMNDKMYACPATQQAMHTLAQWENVNLLDCAEGELACGTSGKGRMQEPEVICEAIESALTPKTLSGKRIVITAGPTQEKIDPVRFISNYSTGKMGYALALECTRRGAEVTVVSGPVHLNLPTTPYTIVPVTSAREMCEAAKAVWKTADAAILCAAVADFAPDTTAEQKIKKQPGQTGLQLNLITNPDIAATLGSTKRPEQCLIGFALETHDAEQNALHKLESKNLDMIVLNSLQDKGAGFGCDTNKVTLILRDGQKNNLPLMSKQEVAQKIVDLFPYFLRKPNMP